MNAKEKNRDRRQTSEERSVQEREQLMSAANNLLRAAGLGDRAPIKPDLNVEIGTHGTTLTMNNLAVGIARTLFGAKSDVNWGLSGQLSGFSSLTILNEGHLNEGHIDYSTDGKEKDDRIPPILIPRKRGAKPRIPTPQSSTGKIAVAVSSKQFEARFSLQKIPGAGEEKKRDTYNLTIQANNPKELATLLDLATKGTELKSDSKQKSVVIMPERIL